MSKSWFQELKDVFKPNRKLKDRIRDFINFLDTPFDNLKHKIHGLKIFGFRIRLPNWMMRGKGDPTK